MRWKTSWKNEFAYYLKLDSNTVEKNCNIAVFFLKYRLMKLTINEFEICTVRLSHTWTPIIQIVQSYLFKMTHLVSTVHMSLGLDSKLWSEMCYIK